MGRGGKRRAGGDRRGRRGQPERPGARDQDQSVPSRDQQELQEDKSSSTSTTVFAAKSAPIALNLGSLSCGVGAQKCKIKPSNIVAAFE